MNIIFVNYGDHTSNSLNHIHGYALAAHQAGHCCIVALPSLPQATKQKSSLNYKILSYNDILHSSTLFENNADADIIHAWTPREHVRRFVLNYRVLSPHSRLIIHLEDNEAVLLDTYSNRSIGELQSLPKELLNSLIPPQLSHPSHYKKFLRDAQGVTYITERLKIFSSTDNLTHLLYPGIESFFFNTTLTPNRGHPRLPIELLSSQKVIVYTGSTTFATLKDIRTLLAAVCLINDQGTPCKLVRTGIHPRMLEAHLEPLTRDHVIDLGFIDKAEIPSLLSIADALVQPGGPNDFNECRLPSKIPEFLASGRPTIIPHANIGHHIIDGEHALLLETGSAQEIANKCLRVFGDQALAARLSIGGRAFARRHFDLEKNTEGLLNFYEEILSKTSPRPPKRGIPPQLSKWLQSTRRFLWTDRDPSRGTRPEPVIEPEYERWLRQCAFNNSSDIQLYQKLGERPSHHQPLISILMPVYNTDSRWLTRAINSVRTQLYPNWELCIADDASTEPAVRRLLEKVAASDPRIKIIYRERNGHISDASNSALTLVSGAFVALLDHDDELSPHALAEVILAVSKNSSLELIYSDHDKIDQHGKRFAPYFKPDWDPDLLLAQNYLCHLTVFRTERLRHLNGFRKGYEGSQDWDLMLRYTEALSPEKIHHIPKVLYHWRAYPGSTALNLDEKNSYPQHSAHKAITDHINRTSTIAELLPVLGQHWRIKYAPPSPTPHVCLILPAIDTTLDARVSAKKIYTATQYTSCQLRIGEAPGRIPSNDTPSTATTAPSITPVSSHICNGAPAYASYANQIARNSNSEILVLLAPDLVPVDPGWLDELVSQISRTNVGAAGGHIIGPDKKILQTGIIVEPSVAGDRFSIVPAFAWSASDAEGYNNRLRLVQDYTALSADGLAIRRDLFLQLGGFDETFISHQSAAIDLCLRIRQTGLRVINTPHAQLMRTSNSRFEIPHPDRIALYQRWHTTHPHDPAYNRNLALYGGGFSLAFPPR